MASNIWDDAGFKEAYRARLQQIHSNSYAEAQAQASAFTAEAKQVGSSAEHFSHRAGAFATATMVSYVRGALDAFDQSVASIGAEAEEADLNVLRESIEQEIARRAKTLPALLRDFSKPTTHPSLLRTILQQSPIEARRILAERVNAARELARARVRERKVPDRVLFISHDARDAALVEALKRVIVAAAGDEVAVFTSTGLEPATRIKASRLVLVLMTPHSVACPTVYWETGMADALEKRVMPVFANGVSASDAATPLGRSRGHDLSTPEGAVRLLHALQAGIEKRKIDPASIVLDDLLGVTSVR